MVIKFKSKKTSDDNKGKPNKQPPAMKSNSASIKNAATTVGEVMSMSVIPVRLRHCSS